MNDITAETFYDYFKSLNQEYDSKYPDISVEQVSEFNTELNREISEYRDQPWFSVFKHSMDHEEGG